VLAVAESAEKEFSYSSMASLILPWVSSFFAFRAIA